MTTEQPPTTTDAPTCDNCGHHLSAATARVIRTPEGRINGCPHCPDRRTHGQPYHREEVDYRV